MNLTKEKETASNGSKEKNLQSHPTEDDLAFTDYRAQNYFTGEFSYSFSFTAKPVISSRQYVFTSYFPSSREKHLMVTLPSYILEEKHKEISLITS